MIHVDVRRLAQQTGNDPYAYIVETSTDGAGWKLQFRCDLQVDETLAEAKSRAEFIARVMIQAWQYAGIECKGTSGGYNL